MTTEVILRRHERQKRDTTWANKKKEKKEKKRKADDQNKNERYRPVQKTYFKKHILYKDSRNTPEKTIQNKIRKANTKTWWGPNHALTKLDHWPNKQKQISIVIWNGWQLFRRTLYYVITGKVTSQKHTLTSLFPTLPIYQTAIMVQDTAFIQNKGLQ